MGGAGAPPTHKIKENLWILIVFGVGWGEPGGPPYPQNQRKHIDFHGFWNEVGGGGCPPPHHKINENLWIFIVFEMGWGGRVPPPPTKSKKTYGFL